MAIFWDLQPLWSSLPTKPDLLRFRCSCRHVLSKTKSVTPHFFYISDIANSSSFNGKIFRKKSMLEKFRANVLNTHDAFKDAIIAAMKVHPKNTEQGKRALNNVFEVQSCNYISLCKTNWTSFNLSYFKLSCV